MHIYNFEGIRIRAHDPGGGGGRREGHCFGPSGKYDIWYFTLTVLPLTLPGVYTKGKKTYKGKYEM